MPAGQQQLTSDERLAKEVLDVLVGCGLSHSGVSLVGGQNFYFPEVVEVVDPPEGLVGPIEGLIIRILPGQHPDDFKKHAKTIAYNLHRVKVEVVELGPYLIRLELWPKLPFRSSL
ncbi:MAG: hypothetical protein ACRDTH_27775 [Pseudonocardiaceae bacterium]